MYMAFNRNYSRKKMVSGGGFQEVDSDETPEATFESIFLQTYFSYIRKRQICSEFEYSPNFCSSSLDALKSCFNMLLPYLYKEGDLYFDGKPRKIDMIELNLGNDLTKEVPLVKYVTKELSFLAYDTPRLYQMNIKKKIEFMQRADFLFSIIPRYFKRMGLGLTELVGAEMHYSRDEK